VKAILKLVPCGKIFPAALFGIASFSAVAQTNTHQITYDTLIPAGTGNSSQNFTFSKFDPSVGTLSAVVVKRRVSINYGFTLKNVESIPRTFTITVGRWDNINSAALSSALSNSTTVGLGSFPLNPNEVVSKSPYTVLYGYQSSDSLTSNLANFLGTGTVSFDYNPITYTILNGSNTYYYTATASDTVRFSLTYIYTNSTLLASGITSFSANRENNHTIKLAWAAENDPAGRSYDIEKSTDGIHFSTAGTVSAQSATRGSYNWHYPVQTEEQQKLYFRLRAVDITGTASLSAIKMVDMSVSVSNTFGIWPNPASRFINISLNDPLPLNWQVDILSAAGVLLQRESISTAGTARIDFRNPISAGVYYLRATERQSGRILVNAFLVK
jgi:hypothetical protein